MPFAVHRIPSRAPRSKGNTPAASHELLCHARTPFRYLSSHPNTKGRMEGRLQLLSDGLRERRRERVANLFVRRSLSSTELPIVWEALDTSDHPHCEARHAGKICARSFIRDAKTINAKSSPCLPRARRSEIRTAVFV